MSVHSKDLEEQENEEEDRKGEEEEMVERNHPKVSYFPLLCPKIYTSCYEKASMHVGPAAIRHTGGVSKERRVCAP